ncbi:hypothetical protein Avbf_02267 [Armadillidium vulgare]|nr:hypothetical protein Avbf_02267 [Armadillidium vulgare]
MDQKRFGKELERGFNSFVFKGKYYFIFILLLLIEMGDGLARKIVPENYNKDFRPGLKDFYTVNELKFMWDKSGLIIDDESLTKTLIDYEATLMKHNETTCFSELLYPDEAACLRLVLTLKRYYWVYLITFFFPSSVIVMG